MRALESDRARVELDPAFGARVTSLRDKRTGREWLVAGPREAGDGATYGGAQARGWDECFPTVAPCAHPAWGPLRDHGLLWGRPWRVEAEGRALLATFEGARFALTRRLELDGATLRAEYRARNLSDAPLPFLWSQHCLLAPRPGERVVLSGVDGLARDGRAAAWPLDGGRDLSRVGAAGDGFAAKLYGRAGARARAAVEGEDGGVAWAWDGGEVPALGLWLDWGGWPEGAGVHQMALEPTHAPFDDLLAADAAGAAPVLAPAGAPGAAAAWRVAITLTDPP